MDLSGRLAVSAPPRTPAQAQSPVVLVDEPTLQFEHFGPFQLFLPVIG